MCRKIFIVYAFTSNAAQLTIHAYCSYKSLEGYVQFTSSPANVSFNTNYCLITYILMWQHDNLRNTELGQAQEPHQSSNWGYTDVPYSKKYWQWKNIGKFGKLQQFAKLFANFHYFYNIPYANVVTSIWQSFPAKLPSIRTLIRFLINSIHTLLL